MIKQNLKVLQQLGTKLTREWAKIQTFFYQKGYIQWAARNHASRRSWRMRRWIGRWSLPWRRRRSHWRTWRSCRSRSRRSDCRPQTPPWTCREFSGREPKSTARARDQKVKSWNWGNLEARYRSGGSSRGFGVRGSKGRWRSTGRASFSFSEQLLPWRAAERERKEGGLGFKDCVCVVRALPPSARAKCKTVSF